MGFWSGTKSVFKKSVLAGFIGAGVVTAPFVISEYRNSRKASDDDLPPPPELTAPMPNVLEAPPLVPDPALAGQPTLMGNPLVEGDKVAMVRARRSGGAGLDTSAPNIMLPDGSNQIDGSKKGIQELNSPAGGGAYRG